MGVGVLIGFAIIMMLLKHIFIRTNQHDKLERNEIHIANYKYCDEFVHSSYLG